MASKPLTMRGVSHRFSVFRALLAVLFALSILSAGPVPGSAGTPDIVVTAEVCADAVCHCEKAPPDCDRSVVCGSQCSPVPLAGISDASPILLHGSHALALAPDEPESLNPPPLRRPPRA